MMKQVNKKTSKKRIRFSGLIFVTFMITFVAFLASSIVLKSLNVSLNLTKQQYENQIATIRNTNETLQYEVKELGKYDRIINIIDKDMYAVENVVYLVSE